MVVLALSATAQVVSDTTQPTPKKDSKLLVLKSLQSVAAEANSEANKYLPNYTPLSPNAAGIQKFQDYQVNLSSGSPSISFTLFNATSGNLNLPITLHYNSFNGHTLTDLASWVGWGWSLDLGINMSRNIRGAADDYPNSTNYLNTTRSFDWDVCDNVIDYSNAPFANEGTYDLEPDIYSYAIGSASGKFNLKKSSLEPFLIPYQPVKIEHDYVSGSRITQWKITGPDGVTYVFGKDKYGNVINDWQYSDDVGQLYSNSGTTTWHATQILSPNTDDRIEIEYYPEEVPRKEINLNSYSWSATEVSIGPGMSQFINPVSNMQRRFNTQRYIKKITFDNGYLEFIVSDNAEIRLDQPESKILKQINVYNFENGQPVLIKSFRFNYSYFTDRTGSDARLKLDSYDEGNETFTEKITTSFEYFTNNYSWKYNSGPFGADIEDFKKVDYFGYYNGKLNNHTFDIDQYILEGSLSITPVFVLGGKANRDTDPKYLYEGVLKKITLPTGGHTEFEFEPHRFKLNNTIRIGGGLRIKSISNRTDSSTLATLRTFKYSCDDGPDLGKLTNSWNLPATKVTGFQNQAGGLSKIIFFSPDGDLILNAIDGTPVYYTDVKEYATVNNDSNGYKESAFSFYRDTQFDGIQYAVYDIQPWKRGLLLSEKIFDKDDNLISVTSNNYQEFKTENLKNIGKIFQRSISPEFVSCASGMPSGYQGGCNTCYEYSYYSNISKTGVMKLVQSTSSINGVSSTSTMEYNDYLMPAITTMEDSKKDIKKTETRYSTDAMFDTDPAIQSLEDKNMIVPIETINSIVKGPNTYITSKQRTFYSHFAGINSSGYPTNTLPSSIWVAKTGSQLEKRVEYASYYPNGKPKEYSIDGQSNTLVWGYGNKLLLAEIKNATTTDVENMLNLNNINIDEMSVTSLTEPLKLKLFAFQNSLSGSLVSWYTHRPLVGVSEKYEPNGIKTTYEYDALLRLKNMKDTNGNLIKSNAYHYISGH